MHAQSLSLQHLKSSNIPDKYLVWNSTFLAVLLTRLASCIVLQFKRKFLKSLFLDKQQLNDNTSSKCTFILLAHCLLLITTCILLSRVISYKINLTWFLVCTDKFLCLKLKFFQQIFTWYVRSQMTLTGRSVI